MTQYILQSVLLGCVLSIFARRNGKFNTYQIFFALIWTIAVIGLKVIYGDNQITFYSNDQQIQLEILNKIETIGLNFSINDAIDNRYLILIPVWFLKLFGIQAILALKFLQAICLTTIYRVCSDYLTANNLKVKLYQAIFYSGPLFIFLSILGLRDLEIALGATYFFIGKSANLRIISLLVTIFLRPHLAVALIFGWLVTKYIERFKIKQVYMMLLAVVISSFIIGSYVYLTAKYLRPGIQTNSQQVFSQDAWWRLFANFLGLQFLTFGDDVVQMSVSQLILLRLFFVDTFLIPILFIITLLRDRNRYLFMQMQVLSTFVFFLGIVAQTNFNSSRQNLPFLAAMGVLALLGFIEPEPNNPDSISKKRLRFK